MALPHRTWNFDIDRLLNPLVPSPPWRFLPYPVARWLGYRKSKPQGTGNIMPILWAFIGAFVAILMIQAVSKRVPSFEARGAPMIVGSFVSPCPSFAPFLVPDQRTARLLDRFRTSWHETKQTLTSPPRQGAAAVLEFYAIESPLAQPRNAILGQLVSTFVGIAIGKLFQLSDSFKDIQWLGGALACACATALMALTKTVHPPAGATALLAVVDDTLVHLGWFMLPVVLLGCALMLGVALLVNNLERRFPMYWWTPEDLGTGRSILRRRHSTESNKDDVDEEKAEDGLAAPASAVTSRKSTVGDAGNNVESSDSDAVGGTSVRFTNAHQHAGEVVIRRGEVIVPEHMFLTQEEQQLLETLTYRL
ncbi:HPP family protein [Metarhizium album ARSEF 1941]|uniref:HPP family protein n=1 Tax=Metarhizium album (strain ARSEF 1941) TaxID=1081103 RepID=A0A0B2WZD8_METAS|nr:HPP family protein [Metarhizium album ARSEF 1941]KHN98944.1 HPP family protein [Metarhizium album ARSEF 1941]